MSRYTTYAYQERGSTQATYKLYKIEGEEGRTSYGDGPIEDLRAKCHELIEAGNQIVHWTTKGIRQEIAGVYSSPVDYFRGLTHEEIASINLN